MLEEIFSPAEEILITIKAARHKSWENEFLWSNMGSTLRELGLEPHEHQQSLHKEYLTLMHDIETKPLLRSFDPRIVAMVEHAVAHADETAEWLQDNTSFNDSIIDERLHRRAEENRNFKRIMALKQSEPELYYETGRVEAEEFLARVLKLNEDLTHELAHIVETLCGEGATAYCMCGDLKSSVQSPYCHTCARERELCFYCMAEPWYDGDKCRECSEI